MPVARDGSASLHEDPAHPYAVWVQLRDEGETRQPFDVIVWVGLGDLGEVDVDAAVRHAEDVWDAVAQDWGAA